MALVILFILHCLFLIGCPVISMHRITSSMKQNTIYHRHHCNAVMQASSQQFLLGSDSTLYIWYPLHGNGDDAWIPRHLHDSSSTVERRWGSSHPVSRTTAYRRAHYKHLLCPYYILHTRTGMLHYFHSGVVFSFADVDTVSRFGVPVTFRFLLPEKRSCSVRQH